MIKLEPCSSSTRRKEGNNKHESSNHRSDVDHTARASRFYGGDQTNTTNSERKHTLQGVNRVHQGYTFKELDTTYTYIDIYIHIHTRIYIYFDRTFCTLAESSCFYRNLEAFYFSTLSYRYPCRSYFSHLVEESNIIYGSILLNLWLDDYCKSKLNSKYNYKRLFRGRLREVNV